MTPLRVLSLAVYPAVGSAFVGLWIVAEAAREPNVPVMVALGLAIALVRILPFASLALALVGEGISAVGAATPSGSWVHLPMSTDWALYLAALVIPALVVATGSRRTLRPSLVAAFIGAMGLSALIALSGTQVWATRIAVGWMGGGEDALPLNVFITLGLVFALLAGGAWLLGWGAAGFVRFLTTLTRDPLIRVRLHDALSLGTISEELPALTPRERDVLLLVADGMSNAQIATALFLSEATVKSHLRNILSKFQLSSRTEVVALAWRTGLVRAEKPQVG